MPITRQVGSINCKSLSKALVVLHPCRLAPKPMEPNKWRPFTSIAIEEPGGVCIRHTARNGQCRFCCSRSHQLPSLLHLKKELNTRSGRTTCLVPLPAQHTRSVVRKLGLWFVRRVSVSHQPSRETLFAKTTQNTYWCHVIHIETPTLLLILSAVELFSTS